MTRQVIITGPTPLAGRLSVPGDKSITHRALIFSALAVGRARIANILTSADCLSTLNCLRRLGVNIELDGTDAAVDGVGFFGFKAPDAVLDVGNSGTALRVLPALLAAQSFSSIVDGDESIRKRPVDRVIKPLMSMGARIQARSGGRFAPMSIEGGPLRGIEYELPVASAQVKTAVIVAGLLAKDRTVIAEPILSRDHTERMLEYLGAAIRVEDGAERRIFVEGGVPFAAKDITVPGDISSAAFFLAAGVLGGRGVEIEGVGLNPTRTGFIDVLQEMGAEPQITAGTESAGEPVGSIAAGLSSLVGARIGGALIPRVIDELPLVALLATQAEGRTTVADAAELRVKETDRVETVVSELKKMRAHIEATPDGFIVEGPTRLVGATVNSHGDHRLAMMLAVAATIAEGQTTIENAGAVDVSFPGFFEKLRSLGADISVEQA